MAYSRDKGSTEVNAGSMADIAFLLLIFFLVTTQIATNKGITMVLPPPRDLDQPIVPFNERNILKIQINSFDKIMLEDELVTDISTIREAVYHHALNFGAPDDVKRGRDNITDRETYQSLPAFMKGYIQNNLTLRTSSDGPSKAVVSLKTDRGSGYDVFIQVMDEISAAYYRIYGERVGLTAEEFRKLNRNDPRQRVLYEEGKRGIVKAISLAEPTEAGVN